MTRVTDSTKFKDLEKTVLKAFRKLEVMADLVNVQDCHWLKSSSGFKKVTIKLSKRKYAAKLQSLKKNLNAMDLSSFGIREKV